MSGAPAADDSQSDSGAEDAIATFFQVFPGAPLPQRADPTLRGAVPARAEHYCEPFTTATGFGWHLFPPRDFALLWDGATVSARLTGARDWTPVESVALPGFPQYLAGYCPFDVPPPRALPFLATSSELPGLVQIWTGTVARTPPGWSLLVRPPANLPRHPGYEVLEGVIETDWWFGPLIAAVRLCQIGRPIPFSVSRPLYQVQPVPKRAYQAKTLKAARIAGGFEQFTEREWRDFAATLELRIGRQARPGSYRAEVRRRARQER